MNTNVILKGLVILLATSLGQGSVLAENHDAGMAPDMNKSAPGGRRRPGPAEGSECCGREVSDESTRLRATHARRTGSPGGWGYTRCWRWTAVCLGGDARNKPVIQAHRSRYCTGIFRNQSTPASSSP